jgi:hypothetical protein
MERAVLEHAVSLGSLRDAGMMSNERCASSCSSLRDQRCAAKDIEAFYVEIWHRCALGAVREQNIAAGPRWVAAE